MATQTSSLNPAAWDRATQRQIANIVALGAVLTVNALSNLLPINGVTAGEISDSFPSLFTPAGYVFSIWGIIYLSLIAFVVYQVLPSQKDNPRLERLGYAFVTSCVFNFSWIFAWHYGVIWLSELLIVGLLVSLIVCYTRLGIGQKSVSWTETLTTRLAFSLYLGWLTVATAANTSVLLLEYGASANWLAPLWTLLVIAVAAGIGYLMLKNRGDVAFNAVLMWAFIGVAAKQWGAELLIVVGALIATGFVAYYAALTLRKQLAG